MPFGLRSNPIHCRRNKSVQSLFAHPLLVCLKETIRYPLSIITCIKHEVPQSSLRKDFKLIKFSHEAAHWDDFHLLEADKHD